MVGFCLISQNFLLFLCQNFCLFRRHITIFFTRILRPSFNRLLFLIQIGLFLTGLLGTA